MIKIDNASKVQTSKRTERKKLSASGESGFSQIIDAMSEPESAPSPSTVASTQSLGSLEMLVSVQGVAEEVMRRQKHIKQAHLTLDALEELRHALLIGTVPVYLLQGIEKRMSELKRANTSPELTEIVEEIELRAAVELAKFRMQRYY